MKTDKTSGLFFNFLIINSKLIMVLFSLLIMLVSCSSAPKNAGDIDVMRKIAETWLEEGVKEAGQGRFDSAFAILTEAKRYGILTDDSSLIIRACLSRGNVLHSLGRTNDAFSEWNQAVTEAERFKDAELLSAAKIFLARGNLVTERLPARSVLDEVNRESANLKKSRMYIAFSWQVIGLAHSSLGSYNDAEAAFRKSLAIHEKDRFLENASFDWYSIASVRSLAGNTNGALQALEASMVIDRRIENSWGLAASYRAMGDIYRKAGRQNEAVEAYRRARAIFAVMDNQNEVADIDRRIRI